MDELDELDELDENLSAPARKFPPPPSQIHTRLLGALVAFAARAGAMGPAAVVPWWRPPPMLAAYS